METDLLYIKMGRFFCIDKYRMELFTDDKILYGFI